MVFPTFFNLSLNLAIKSSWSEPQSAPGLVFADCIEFLHLWLQRIQSVWFWGWPSGDVHCYHFNFEIPWWPRLYRVCLQNRRPRLSPWAGKSPWRRKRQPTPVCLPGRSTDRGAWRTAVHGGHKKLDASEWIDFPHFPYFNFKSKMLTWHHHRLLQEDFQTPLS